MKIKDLPRINELSDKLERAERVLNDKNTDEIRIESKSGLLRLKEDKHLIYTTLQKIIENTKEELSELGVSFNI